MKTVRLMVNQHHPSSHFHNGDIKNKWSLSLLKMIKKMSDVGWKLSVSFIRKKKHSSLKGYIVIPILKNKQKNSRNGNLTLMKTNLILKKKRLTSIPYQNLFFFHKNAPEKIYQDLTMSSVVNNLNIYTIFNSYLS